MYKVKLYDYFFKKWKVMFKSYNYYDCQDFIKNYDRKYEKLLIKLKLRHYKLDFKIEKC